MSIHTGLIQRSVYDGYRLRPEVGSDELDVISRDTVSK